MKSFQEIRNMGEAKLSTKKRFDMYKTDYGIKAHGMQDRKEAEKVIRFIFNVKKDLMPDQMKTLVDKGLFDEGIKQGVIGLMKTYTTIAKQSGKKTDAAWKKHTSENASWMSKRFDNNGWVQRFDYESFIKKNLK
jgi:hypothetical protein